MLTDAQIQAAADRIAAALHPKKIILFGSYARGDANEHSDLDLMVIEPDIITKKLSAIAAGLRAVSYLHTGVDIVVYSQEEFHKHSHHCTQPAYWARKEGRLLYDA